MGIDPIFATVVMILQLQAGQPIGSASGFFYSRNEQIYLVTNRHVVKDDDSKKSPDTLRLLLHKKGSKVGPGINFDVPLYRKNTRQWMDHPKFQRLGVDVSAIRLDREALLRDHFVIALSSENFLPSKYALSTGEDVMAIGFPRGLSDTPHNLAITRSAMIASSFGVYFQEKPLFLIDANLHPGMSGSAVLTRPKNIWQTRDGGTAMTTGSPTYLLGIHSATLGVKLPEGQEALGLGTVWYARVIEELLDAARE